MSTGAKPAEKPAEEFAFVDAQWDLKQSFRRDPMQPAFFAGLKEKRLLGARDANGRVLFPPHGFSDVTFSTLTELVPVGPEGTIRTLTMIPGGGPKNRPPVLAVYVQLDGAQSAASGLLRGASTEPADLATYIGKRCRAVFKDEPAGAWSDFWYELV